MNVKDICLDKSRSIKEAIIIMDTLRTNTVFVLEDNKLFGVVTDGDIRRSIMNGNNVKSEIHTIANRNPIINSKDAFKRLSDNVKTIIVPILDKNECIIDGIIVSKDKRPYSITQGKIRTINKVLVIGGAGYLGSVLCRKLLEKNYSVRVLDNLMYGNDSIKNLYNNPKFEIINGDIRNIQMIVKALEGTDAVIHLAAIVGDSASSLNPIETIEINYLSSKMIAEICKYSQINRFIFASTCSVYGTSEEDEFLGEASPLNPISLYANMKLKSEEGILGMSDDTFSPTVLRMATLYGESPRMRFDLVVNILSIKAILEKKFEILGGSQFRALCHVSDAADAYIICLEAPIEVVRNQIFNVASENYSIIDIGNYIKKIVPDADMVINADEKDKRNYKVSNDKIWRKLSFLPKYNIEDGIKEIIEHKDKYLDYNNPKYSNYEYLVNK